MALKNLSNDEMRILTALAVGELRAHLVGDPHLGLVLAELDSLAPLFDEFQRKVMAADPAAAALVADGARADAEHDRLLRGLFTLLEALETLAGDGGDGPAYAALRHKLFPGGLSMAQRSYAEQAGEAQRALRRLDEADVALLRDLPLRGGQTAFDFVQAWGRSGAGLDEIEKRRLQLGEREAAAQVRSIDMRNRWIRTVRMLESVVAIRGEATHPVLDAIRRYEEKADRRARSAAPAVEQAAPV